MGYQTLIDSNITLAFNLLKDLAKDVILHKSSSNVFDFDTAEMAIDSGKMDIPIKAVIIEDDKKSRADNTRGTLNAVKRQLLFKTRGLNDINAYDSVSIDNELWKFSPTLNNDGYTILADIYREV